MFLLVASFLQPVAAGWGVKVERERAVRGGEGAGVRGGESARWLITDWREGEHIIIPWGRRVDKLSDWLVGLLINRLTYWLIELNDKFQPVNNLMIQPAVWSLMFVITQSRRQINYTSAGAPLPKFSSANTSLIYGWCVHSLINIWVRGQCILLQNVIMCAFSYKYIHE